MADQEHNHEHGTMDTKVQEATFDGFVKMVTWGAIISIALLVFIGLVNG
ncbi:MAG: aa3-type cytochrome c oxidase subunit IV [Pseudomonadota bacterium]